jgi:hypothetical protein
MPQSNAQHLQSDDDAQSSTATGKRPVEKFRDGPVQISIWENQATEGAFRTATFDLRYKDRNEEWQTGHSYTSSDLQHLETAAREARSRINSWRQRNTTDPTVSP